jgi:phosphohistidine swiveling domain-containing protein
VLATRSATKDIVDGVTVTVDGDQGLVRVAG